MNFEEAQILYCSYRDSKLETHGSTLEPASNLYSYIYFVCLFVLICFVLFFACSVLIRTAFNKLNSQSKQLKSRKFHIQFGLLTSIDKLQDLVL